MAVELRPLQDGDRDRVARFLQANMDVGASVEQWRRAVTPPWGAGRDGGAMLVDDGELVGVYVVYRSERVVDGRPRRFCNLGTWCVRPSHRMHSLRLLEAVLDDADCHYTDLSPSRDVVALDRRLGFRALATTATVVPNLPWPSWPGGGRVSSDPAAIERALGGEQLAAYRDHRDTAGALHAVLERGGRACYVVVRRERRRRLPVAILLYVGDAELFRALSRPLARHLLVRFGALALIAERQIVDFRPRLSIERQGDTRMHRGEGIDPADVDYLYSELVCLSW